MGRVRPRRLLVGAAVLMAALLWSGAADSQTGPSSVVTATVSADGALDAPAGWRLAHPSPGVYRVVVDAATVDLDVTTWDGPADVTIVPLGSGRTEVRFDLGGVPVDSRFVFTAIARD